MSAPWTYQANIHRIIDGDTLDLTIDLGFDIQHTIRVRLAGIDTPEMRTPEGKAARAWVVAWCDHIPTVPYPYTITTQQVGNRDKYGRWVATIHYAHHPRSLNDDLLAARHATPWPNQ